MLDVWFKKFKRERIKSAFAAITARFAKCGKKQNKDIQKEPEGNRSFTLSRQGAIRFFGAGITAGCHFCSPKTPQELSVS